MHGPINVKMKQMNVGCSSVAFVCIQIAAFSFCLLLLLHLVFVFLLFELEMEVLHHFFHNKLLSRLESRSAISILKGFVLLDYVVFCNTN